MKKAVLLISFNRLDYTKKSFEAIRAVRPPKLYLAVDGPRPNKVGETEKVQEIRNYLVSHVDWPCQVKTRFLETNSGGCKYGVSGAVSWLFENESDWIILEDDCVANPSFFSYCEELLDKYKDDKRVWHIAGHAPIETNIPETYYFSKIQHCWGWATWADRWQYFDVDVTHLPIKELKKFKLKPVIKHMTTIYKALANGEDTWDWQWSFDIVAHDGLCITASNPLVSNIGVANGVHYSNAINDPQLNKTPVGIDKIVHPKKVALNIPLTRRIYSEVFGIDCGQHIFRKKQENGHVKFYVLGFKVLSFKRK